MYCGAHGIAAGTVNGLHVRNSVFGWIGGGLNFRYYPSLKGIPLTPFTLGFFLVYLALCLTPLILNGREDVKWKHLRSGT